MGEELPIGALKVTDGDGCAMTTISKQETVDMATRTKKLFLLCDLVYV